MISLKDILDATGGQLLHAGAEKFTGISVDSRTLKKGELYVALPGKRVDGHRFIADAICRGASGVLVSRPFKVKANKIAVIRVRNTQKALEAIGLFLRQRRAIFFVGITGSSGKTTVKEMVAAILQKKYRVFKNMGNLNTEIGVPLSLVPLSSRHDVGVVELAMQRQGEIRLLTKMVKPKVGVITNIGPAHVQYLKTLKNIARAKGELLEELPKDGIAILPRDDAYYPTLKKIAGRRHVITFGVHRDADVRAANTSWKGASMRVVVQIRRKRTFTIHLNTPGLHMVQNALAAISVGLLFGVPQEMIQDAIKNYRPVGSRFALQKSGKLLIIRDEYNANPDSMKHAIETLASIGKARNRPTVAILGDMLELGKESKKFHAKVGKQIRKRGITHLVAVGKDAAQYVQHARLNGSASLSDTYSEAAKQLRKILRDDNGSSPVILFKGSRGMHLERVAKLARI